jgi:hypothetical protein
MAATEAVDKQSRFPSQSRGVEPRQVRPEKTPWATRYCPIQRANRYHASICLLRQIGQMPDVAYELYSFSGFIMPRSWSPTRS